MGFTTMIGKLRMEIYLKFIIVLVENDYELPTKIVECVKLYKPEDKWDEAGMKKDTLNARG